MIITEILYFFSKIIRFQAIFKGTVEFTYALEFKISSQPKVEALLCAKPLSCFKFIFSYLCRAVSAAESHCHNRRTYYIFAVVS